MRTKISSTIYFAVASLVFLTGTIQAFTFSKDTVYEDGFSHWDSTQHKYASTNDNVTLINNSPEPDTITYYNLYLNNGKYAELEMYWGNGNVETDKLILFKVIGNHQFSQSSVRVIAPNDKLVMSTFLLDNCLACPVSKSAASSVGMDTVIAFLILKSTQGLDTLRIVGDIHKESTSTKKINFGLGKKSHSSFDNGKNQSNSLGVIKQSEHLNTPQILFNFE